MAPIKKPFRSKNAKSFELVQLNRECAALLLPSLRLITHIGKNTLPPEGLDTGNPPLRRSARLREKNVNGKVEYSNISRRQSPEKVKIRENKSQGQLQQKNKSLQTKKGC